MTFVTTVAPIVEPVGRTERRFAPRSGGRGDDTTDASEVDWPLAFVALGAPNANPAGVR
jgi:hypothetical protein